MAVAEVGWVEDLALLKNIASIYMVSASLESISRQPSK